MTTRKERLSVSTANALENFGILEEEFRKHQVVVFLDYDGTLTPIVNDPSSATLSSKMKGVLKDLHRLFITGVISGRSLPKIQSFVSIPELYYAGSHGFDIAGPNGTFIQNRIAADFLHELGDLRDLIKQTIQHIPGSEVEDNIFSISLHYRNVDPAFFKEIDALVEKICKDHPRIRCNRGKMVYEFKPKIDWNKGKALVWLLQALGLDQHEEVFTIYIGDDTTDEDAFAVFRCTANRKGVGIVVTERSIDSGAYYTLRDTDEVCEFLKRLIEFKSTNLQKRGRQLSPISSTASTCSSSS